MKKIILLFIIIQTLGTETSVAQTSENAKKLLDEVSKTIYYAGAFLMVSTEVTTRR